MLVVTILCTSDSMGSVTFYCSDNSRWMLISPSPQPDEKGQINSLSTVLGQEVDRFNNLLRVLKVSPMASPDAMPANIATSCF